MKPLLISSGEPAGIGPDLCLELANHNIPAVVLGDISLLEKRARELNLKIQFIEYQTNKTTEYKPGCLVVHSVCCPNGVESGKLNQQNASYVMDLLTQSALLCKQGEFSALVTAPVHKAVINEAGIPFTGHTEFFAQYYDTPNVVMMLACEQMKVALVTTHLPLREVPDAITPTLVIQVIRQLCRSLENDFGIKNPLIKVAGLNPHAGESGYLGREEIEVINPALDALRKESFNLHGPCPADTMYTQDNVSKADAYVAMYHDQGLPVLKYAGFNHAVNITLGLPIIRTSVDHGTALDIAGKGIASSGSLLAAVKMAITMARNRMQL